RPEQQSERGKRLCCGGDDDRRNGPRNERADRGNAESDASPPLLRHLMSVEYRYDGCGLAWDVDEDRRGRSAVLSTVVDAGQHDERADGIEPESERQQHGDCGDRTNTRKHADQRADQAAEEAETYILD